MRLLNVCVLVTSITHSNTWNVGSTRERELEVEQALRPQVGNHVMRSLCKHWCRRACIAHLKERVAKVQQSLTMGVHDVDSVLRVSEPHVATDLQPIAIAGGNVWKVVCKLYLQDCVALQPFCGGSFGGGDTGSWRPDGKLQPYTSHKLCHMKLATRGIEGTVRCARHVGDYAINHGQFLIQKAAPGIEPVSSPCSMSCMYASVKRLLAGTTENGSDDPSLCS
jgi:hypothetical protein